MREAACWHRPRIGFLVDMGFPGVRLGVAGGGFVSVSATQVYNAADFVCALFRSCVAMGWQFTLRPHKILKRSLSAAAASATKRQLPKALYRAMLPGNCCG